MNSPSETWNRIHVQLDDTNYPTWLFLMQHLLRSRGLLKFVDGSFSVSKMSDYEHWMEQDSLVISLIAASLSSDALTLVTGCETSIEVWTTLKQHYAPNSEFHISRLKSTMQNIRKGSDTIDKYLLRIKSVRDKLTAAGYMITDQDMMHFILTGLPTEYGYTRQIIRGQSHIDLADVRNLLLSAECEIEIGRRTFTLSNCSTMCAQNSVWPALSTMGHSTYSSSLPWSSTCHGVQANVNATSSFASLPQNDVSCLQGHNMGYGPCYSSPTPALVQDFNNNMNVSSPLFHHGYASVQHMPTSGTSKGSLSSMSPIMTSDSPFAVGFVSPPYCATTTQVKSFSQPTPFSKVPCFSAATPSHNSFSHKSVFVETYKPATGVVLPQFSGSCNEDPNQWIMGETNNFHQTDGHQTCEETDHPDYKCKQPLSVASRSPLHTCHEKFATGNDSSLPCSAGPKALSASTICIHSRLDTKISQSDFNASVSQAVFPPSNNMLQFYTRDNNSMICGQSYASKNLEHSIPLIPPG